jgi:hypothetical protein
MQHSVSQAHQPRGAAHRNRVGGRYRLVRSAIENGSLQK